MQLQQADPSVSVVTATVLQLKHGEIHSTVHAAAVLTGTQYALEVQMSAYTLLQILVSSRPTACNSTAPAGCSTAASASPVCSVNMGRSLSAACIERLYQSIFLGCHLAKNQWHVPTCVGTVLCLLLGRFATGGLSCQQMSSRRSRSWRTNT
jgi:hypothetical protein